MTQSGPSAVNVHLVRHGQSDWNATGLVQGGRDEPELTELGRTQAVEAAASLAGLGITAILSSDLTRARQTAMIIGARLRLPVVHDHRLREQGLGVAEGRHRDAVLVEFADYDWTDVDAHLPGGGESLRRVHTRVQPLAEECRAGAHGDQVVWVTHGDTARVALAVLAGRPVESVGWTGLRNGEVVSSALTDSKAPREVDGGCRSC